MISQGGSLDGLRKILLLNCEIPALVDFIKSFTIYLFWLQCHFFGSNRFRDRRAIRIC